MAYDDTADYTAEDHFEIQVGADMGVSWYADDGDADGPADWTGWSGKLQVRTSRHGGTLLATIATAGTRDGNIVFSDSGGVTANLPHTFTAGLVPRAQAVFDLLLIAPDGYVSRAVEGTVAITPEVTI